MIGSAAQESEILTQILSMRDDPVAFVTWVYPWGRPGTPFEKFPGPRDWQLEELDRIGRHTRSAAFKLDNGLPADIFRAPGRPVAARASPPSSACWRTGT